MDKKDTRAFNMDEDITMPLAYTSTEQRSDGVWVLHWVWDNTAQEYVVNQEYKSH